MPITTALSMVFWSLVCSLAYTAVTVISIVRFEFLNEVLSLGKISNFDICTISDQFFIDHTINAPVLICCENYFALPLVGSRASAVGY